MTIFEVSQRSPSMTIASDNYSPSAAQRLAVQAARRLPALKLLPGVALSGAVAGTAFLIRQVPGVATFSPMILAIIIGMTFRNIVGTPSLVQPGIAFSLRRLLRAGIVLLGFQLTFTQIISVGSRGLLIAGVSLAATFTFTLWAGRLLKVGPKLTELIAAGTSICGASAIVATNTVTDAHDEDVAYAIACVTIFGSIAMFAYPLLPGLLYLDAHAYGLWSGVSIHEIAQVVAASFQNGQRAGEIGTTSKLARVMLLAPTIFALNVRNRLFTSCAAAKAARPPIPWFVLGFIAVAGLNSIVVVPVEASKSIATLTTFLLSVALAAMGLETDVAKLYAKGFRPAVLGALAFLFIAIFSLTLIKLLG
jgi:uncharacterized integral membrane protein (TIGR00698 family)